MFSLILAGDVGGTKTGLGLFRSRGGRVETIRETTVSTAGARSLEELLISFLGPERETVSSVCLGVAGAVGPRGVYAPNLPWPVEADRVARATGTSRVILLNDLKATAYGIDELAPTRLVVLQEGERDPGGSRALLAAGTGLGQAHLAPGPTGFVPRPSEGGHVDFAPVDDEQMELLGYLRERFGRVSCERVLSGPGLVNLYRFLVQTGREVVRPEVSQQMLGDDPATVITEAGLRETDPACSHALDLLVRIYGALAGNVALQGFATGGIYLGGGIGPRILPRLQQGGFLKAFRSKGRMEPLMRTIPVMVITEPRTALLGAARRAVGEEANDGP